MKRKLDIDFTDGQRAAIEATDTHRVVFVEGPGGTGKSFLIKHLTQQHANVHLLSSTGISAYAIGGMTVHAFLARIKMPESPFYLDLQSDHIVIVDEISMLGKKMFDRFEEELRMVMAQRTMREEPFGGLRIWLFGDFAQLPPVNDEYCFESLRWEHVERTIALREIKRQDDALFIEFLLRVRSGKLTFADRRAIQALQRHPSRDDAVHLFASNEEAQAYNEACLDELCARTRQARLPFEADVKTETFSDDEIDAFFASRHQFCRTLHLAVGARVMLTKNVDVSAGWCNGTQGVVMAFGTLAGVPFVKVRNDAGVERDLSRQSYRRVKCGQECRAVVNGRVCGRSKCTQHPQDERCTSVMTHGPRKGKVCGAVMCRRHPQSEVAYLDTDGAVGTQSLEVQQFPLVLSWGITVHKSQGMTLDACTIHLPKYKYCPSLIYVALSRCRTRDGIAIVSETPIKYDTICPETAVMSRSFKYHERRCTVCGDDFIGPYPYCRDCSCAPGKYSLYCFTAFTHNMTPDRESYAEWALAHPTFNTTERWRKFVAYLRTQFEIV